ncbi:MAG: secretin N-terminal domain-containing protein, partial [Candidatus Omnitrophota bacterium]
EQALEAILTVNGLVYSINNDIIYVSPGGNEVVELKSEVIFMKYTKAAEAIPMIRKTISAKGDVKPDMLANSLIVTDYPVNIQRVKDLLDKIDVAPRQIIIEAKIADITSSDLSHLGVTWEVDYDPGFGLFDSNALLDLVGGVALPEQSTSLTGGQFTLSAFDFKGLKLTATIDALIRDGKANLLASPSIAVLNGQEARIIIGERYPIRQRTQTTTGTTESTMFVDIGTTLRVTPQINSDGYITMRVHPEVSSLEEQLDAGPRITTREADTTVRIKEGDTLVIGGLIRQSKQGTIDRIPILGYIPIIGYFFSRREKNDEQKELAVFITPRILRSREEKALLAQQTVEKEEAYINIGKTGQLTVVNQIFEKARALDKGHGVESMYKNTEFRKAQALNLYDSIYSQHPDDVKADDALYHAARIYHVFLKDYAKAKERYKHIIFDYPDSEFFKRAKMYYKNVKKIEKRETEKILDEYRKITGGD